MNIIEKILKYLVILAIFVLMVIFLIFPISDLDIWMHLVTGKYIIESLQVPTTDFYSYTAFGRPWVDHEWLAQIIFYLFYQLGSYNGLIILRIILFLLIFSIFFWAIGKKTNYLWAVFISFLTIMVSYDRFILRPEVFTLLFTIIYIFILEEYAKRESKLIYLLPVLQIFWVNLHGYFLLGLIIPLLFFLGQALNRRNNLSFLIKIILLIILASFINPYTYKGFIYPFGILTSLKNPDAQLVLKAISELKPALIGGGESIFWFKLLVVVSVISFILKSLFKNLNWSRILVYFLFLIIGLTVKRHIALFAFPVALITAYNLGDIAGLRPVKVNKLPNPFIKISILLFILAYFFIFSGQVTSNRFYITNRFLKTFDLGLSPEIFPEKAADFLLKHNFKGRIFNDMIGGSYLVWRYYPKEKVFVDGRTEVYGVSIFKDYLSVFSRPELFKGIAEKYNIDYILLNYSLGGRDRLLNSLIKEPLWALVYFDKTAAVFIKNTSQNKNFIDKFKVDLNKFSDPNHYFWVDIAVDYPKNRWLRQEAFPYGYLKTGNLFLNLGYPELAKIAFNKSLELNNRFIGGYLGLGNVYTHQKLSDLALKNYAKAVSVDSNSYEGYLNAAIIYEQQGLWPKAEEYYKKSISKNPSFYLAYHNLGFFYFNQGKFKLAIRPFKKSLKLNPFFTESYGGLGAALANIKELYAAKKNFEKAISLSPETEQLYGNLGLVLQNMGKYNASMAAFQRALRLNQNNIETRHNLAISYLSVGLILKAQEQWLAIKKQEPDNKPAEEYLKKLQLMGYESAYN